MSNLAQVLKEIRDSQKPKFSNDKFYKIETTLRQANDAVTKVERCRFMLPNIIDTIYSAYYDLTAAVLKACRIVIRREETLLHMVTLIERYIPICSTSYIDLLKSLIQWRINPMDETVFTKEDVQTAYTVFWELCDEFSYNFPHFNGLHFQKIIDYAEQAEVFTDEISVSSWLSKYIQESGFKFTPDDNMYEKLCAHFGIFIPKVELIMNT